MKSGLSQIYIQESWYEFSQSEMRNEFLQDFEMNNIKSCQASQSIWQLITQQWKELKIVSNAI